MPDEIIGIENEARKPEKPEAPATSPPEPDAPPGDLPELIARADKVELPELEPEPEAPEPDAPFPNGPTEAGYQAPPADAIPVIAGKNHEASDATEAALKRAGTPIYERGFLLVTPLWREVTAADDRTTITAVLDQLDFYALNDRISATSRFCKFDMRLSNKKQPDKKGTWKIIDPPELVGRTILSRKGRGFRFGNRRLDRTAVAQGRLDHCYARI